MEEARDFQQNIYFCLIDYPKAFDCVDQNKLWKILRDGVSWETYMKVKKQQLEPDMQQLIGSKLVKEYDKAVYCHPVYLTSICLENPIDTGAWWAAVYGVIQSWTRLKWLSSSMQSTWCKMMDWMNHEGCQETYQQPQICRWYHCHGRKWRGTKEPLDESEREEWKSWLETWPSENQDHDIWSHHFMANRRG